jgi:hypothetical protein
MSMRDAFSGSPRGLQQIDQHPLVVSGDGKVVLRSGRLSLRQVLKLYRSAFVDKEKASRRRKKAPRSLETTQGQSWEESRAHDGRSHQ